MLSFTVLFSLMALKVPTPNEMWRPRRSAASRSPYLRPKQRARQGRMQRERRSRGNSSLWRGRGGSFRLLLLLLPLLLRRARRQVGSLCRLHCCCPHAWSKYSLSLSLTCTPSRDLHPLKLRSGQQRSHRGTSSLTQ